MRLIEYNIYKGNQRNASSKAKNDVSDILQSRGFSKLYKPANSRMLRIFQQLWATLFKVRKSVIFIQYPSQISFFYKLLSKKRNTIKIALLHDVQALRGLDKLENEIKTLNYFDAIISHNDKMTEILKENGLHKPIVNINIFDYLIDNGCKVNGVYDRYTVFFAGNLQKSEFLSNLNDISGVTFNIYGAYFKGINSIKDQDNVNYKGSFSPEELISNIEGGWGLIWDGDCLETCSGTNGEYMRYNNPHKVSMCIVSERPVIIWSQSAMAPYIKSKGLGICIDRLDDIFEAINQIGEQEYKQIVARIKEEKKKLIHGENLSRCIDKLIKSY